MHHALPARASGRHADQFNGDDDFGGWLLMQILRSISAVQWNRNSQGLWPNWWDSALLRQYVNEQICHLPGREDGIAAALREQMNGRGLERAVSIGCGDATKELVLLKADIVKAFDLYDISAGQIAAGEKALRAAGLEGRARFLKSSPMEAPPEPVYDLVYWDHSLHHMLDVRAALEWCKKVLAPEGILCINDYVGPTRLQWTRHETKVANVHLAAFERKYGIRIPRISKGNAVKRLRLFLKDPSEAPQSNLIEGACTDIFPGFRLRPLGGAMLNMCGSTIMGLSKIPDGLLQDFVEADRQCLASGIYHFAFGLWQAPR